MADCRPRGNHRAAALLGLACACAPAWPASLSYEEARAALDKASEARMAGEAGLSRRTNEARAADSLGMPELSTSVTQVWGRKTGTLNSPLGAIDINENLNGPRASIDTTWSLYSGGRIQAQQRSLAAGVTEAQSELERIDQKLDADLADVYFGVELAVNVERTRRSVLEQADRQLDRATRFEQRGVIPAVERLNAQVARDEAAREHVRAQRDLEIARMRLQRLLVSAEPIDPTTPLFVITRPIRPLAQWLSLAEADNPLLKGLAAKRVQAEQGVVAAEALWKPDVYAFGSYALIRHYQTLIEPDWRAGIGVSFTLFSREDRSRHVGAAMDTLRQVDATHGETRNEILTAIEAAYRKVEQAREQFFLLESALAGARENLRLRERGFAEGQSTSLDVNEARNSLARAETARAVSAFDFVVALSKLLQVSGQSRSLSEFLQQADVRLTP
jgi:outer membrane protein TolC